MERLVREIERLAREIQQDIESHLDWRRAPTQLVESAQSAEVLERIEHTLATVHGQTTELVERVPKGLSHVLTDLKSTLVLRISGLAQATQSDESGVSRGRRTPNQANQPNQSLLTAARSLTPQERRVFELCFQLGFLSYRDIASRLDITPTAAKNLVNRLFQSDRKRPLFVKEYRHGAVRVSVEPDIHRQIRPTQNEKTARDKRAVIAVPASPPS